MSNLTFGENGELREKFFEEHFCAGRKNEIYVERWIEIGDQEKGWASNIHWLKDLVQRVPEMVDSLNQKRQT